MPEKGFLITASWDKTLKYWDLRSATPGLSVDCGERVYGFDARGGCAVAALAEGMFHGSAAKEKRVLIFDLSNPSKPFRVRVCVTVIGLCVIVCGVEVMVGLVFRCPVPVGRVVGTFFEVMLIIAVVSVDRYRRWRHHCVNKHAA